MINSTTAGARSFLDQFSYNAKEKENNKKKKIKKRKLVY